MRKALAILRLSIASLLVVRSLSVPCFVGETVGASEWRICRLGIRFPYPYEMHVSALLAAVGLSALRTPGLSLHGSCVFVSNRHRISTAAVTHGYAIPFDHSIRNRRMSSPVWPGIQMKYDPAGSPANMMEELPGGTVSVETSRPSTL